MSRKFLMPVAALCGALSAAGPTAAQDTFLRCELDNGPAQIWAFDAQSGAINVFVPSKTALEDQCPRHVNRPVECRISDDEILVRQTVSATDELIYEIRISRRTGRYEWRSATYGTVVGAFAVTDDPRPPARF